MKEKAERAVGFLEVIATGLVVSYFNWIWTNIRWGTTAAMKAGLTSKQGSWDDLITYPTLF